MRLISLLNEYGQEYALNDLDTGLFKDVSGVGFTKDYSYSNIGNSWKANKYRTKQTAFKGKIVNAAHDPYMAEKDLLLFLRSSKKLRIKYTTSAGMWYKDVDIVSYDKSEISKGALSCPVTFMPKSLWYLPTAQRVILETSSGDSKRYDYQYSFAYADFANGYVDIDNVGWVDAAITVDFNGPIGNPSLIVQQNNAEIYRIDITGSASSGEHILFSTVDTDLYLYHADADYNLKTGEGLENLVPDLGIENTNFFKLPIGTSRISVTADGPITAPIIVTVYKYYEVV